MTSHKLLAVKVERRAIASAIFIGDRLDYTQVRQLSSVPDKAEGSAIGFVNWMVMSFRVESAALERLLPASGIRRAQLSRLVIGALRAQSIPVWEIPKRALLEAYGVPPLRTRKELREVVASIWPILDGRQRNNWILDATAIGLLVQTERLLSH